MITVGLDFGTHQTKICIENKDGVELSYEFIKFKDKNGNLNYVIPSIIGLKEDGTLHYGYLDDGFKGEIKKYFKQKSFNAKTSFEKTAALTLSIWYLSFLLFDLEDRFGQDFSIQMGVPTDGIHLNENKQIAVSILGSAYHLVEDVFKNDKDKFLSTKYPELLKLTHILPYSKEIKEEYQILVFPEAYACLKPLIGKGKLSDIGSSMIIDIGGGTTDISFFIIENNKPVVYEFYSLNKGLNYLIAVDINEKKGTEINVKNEREIIYERKRVYDKEIQNIYNKFYDRLIREFNSQTNLKISRLLTRFKNRPLVYSGGGSKFKSLCITHGRFNELHYVTDREWNKGAVIDIETIIQYELCPILSTSYGLSISSEHDNITVMPFRDLFDKLRGLKEEDLSEHKPKKYLDRSKRDYDRFDYEDDYNACK